MEPLNMSMKEKLQNYVQLHTPNYDELSNSIERAKGPNRTMAQFATETGISAPTLSRIVNKNFKKPLQDELLISIYEHRAELDDTTLMDDLISANGLVAKVSVSEVRREHSLRRQAAEREAEKQIAMAKNAIVTSIVSAGIPVMNVQPDASRRFVSDYVTQRNPYRNYKSFHIFLGENPLGVKFWDIYTFISSAPYDRGISSFEVAYLMQLLFPVFLRDAWQPDSYHERKTSFSFIDEPLFTAFVEDLKYANTNSEMSVLLLDPDQDYKVIREQWIPGKHTQPHNKCIF